jgi:hypothetical protein
MAARAAALAIPETPEASHPSVRDDVLLHVRYRPDAEVWHIDKRPAGMQPRDWLNLLLCKAPDCYQILAGGRGFFRIPRARFEGVLATAAK